MSEVEETQLFSEFVKGQIIQPLDDQSEKEFEQLTVDVNRLVGNEIAVQNVIYEYNAMKQEKERKRADRYREQMKLFKRVLVNCFVSDHNGYIRAPSVSSKIAQETSLDKNRIYANEVRSFMESFGFKATSKRVPEEGNQPKDCYVGIRLRKPDEPANISFQETPQSTPIYSGLVSPAAQITH